MTTRLSIPLVALVMLLGVAPAATAQMIDGPQGSVGGIFGGRRPVNPERNSQSLDLSIDMSGGYDHDPNAVLQTPGDVPLPSEVGWYAGSLTAQTNYRVGHTRRSLEVRGRGLANYQDNRPDLLTGGDLGATGVMRFGRREFGHLSASMSASYEPSWVFGAVSPELPGDGPSPIVPALPPGVSEERWLVLSGAVGYTHEWNRRNQTLLNGGGGRVRAESPSGANSEWQNASVQHTLTLNRTLGVVGGYRYNRSMDAEENRPTLPVQYQTLDGGATLTWRFTAERRLSTTASAGATQLLEGAEGQRESFHPAYSFELEYVGSTRWNTGISASRSISVLSGISPVPMITDTAELSFSANLMRRLRINVTSGYLVGNDPGDAIRESNTTTGVTATTDVRYGFGRRFAAFATYNYYHHRLQSLTSGLPPQYDRHSARVGFTYWLPLYGSF